MPLASSPPELLSPETIKTRIAENKFLVADVQSGCSGHGHLGIPHPAGPARAPDEWSRQVARGADESQREDGGPEKPHRPDIRIWAGGGTRRQFLGTM